MKLERREILKLAAGMAFARPALSGEAAAAATGLAQVLPAGRFFSAAEMSLFDAVSEAILPADEHSPGARAAGVAAFVDAQLADKDPKIPDWAEERKAARDSLAALDALCREMKGQGFAEASAAEREAVLTRAAAGESDPKTPAEKAFKWVKGQTAYAYYSSKIGIHQEMEYKGNTLLTEFVGEMPK
ncbi:MAG TPA: gluconate 2-dehydrogenase subunit 3 family protein [Vicinamibacteria bacterium]